MGGGRSPPTCAAAAAAAAAAATVARPTAAPGPDVVGSEPEPVGSSSPGGGVGHGGHGGQPGSAVMGSGAHTDGGPQESAAAVPTPGAWRQCAAPKAMKWSTLPRRPEGNPEPADSRSGAAVAAAASAAAAAAAAAASAAAAAAAANEGEARAFICPVCHLGAASAQSLTEHYHALHFEAPNPPAPAGTDPDVWAALPAEIRAEVIAELGETADRHPNPKPRPYSVTKSALVRTPPRIT